MDEESILSRYKWTGYLTLSNCCSIKIMIAEDNESLHYHITGMKQISRRCKIYSQNNGRLYFIARRRYYYLDQFMMI